MRTRAKRSSALSVAVLILLAAGWLVFAPTSFGGSTDYVTTHGISMEPRFHTGDLALIRPAAVYRVGDVVAYHSDLLHTVVLHRIIGRDGDRYVFKGDNNDFIDPTHPARSQLIGKLWIRVPGGGTALAPLRRPPIAALVIGGVAAMFLLGGGATRRRRRRRRSAFEPAEAAPTIAVAPPAEPTFVAALAEPAPARPTPVGAVAASVAVAARRPVVAPAALAAPASATVAPIRPVVVPAPPALAAPVMASATLAPRPPVVAPAPPALAAPAVASATVTPRPPVVAPAPPALCAPEATPIPIAQPSRPEPTPEVVAAPRAARIRRGLDRRHILIGSAVAALVFLALGLLGFTHRTTKPVAVVHPYTESVAFGYHATVPRAGAAVYPGGSLSTGDPVFLRLVHRVQVTVDYRFAADAPLRLDGALEIVGRISGPTGWTRDIPLAPAQPFSGDRAEGVATLDLRKIRRLTRAVERLTGMPAGGTYTLAVVPRVHATGTLAGQRLGSDFSSQLSFQLDSLQMRPGGGPQKSAPSRHGSVTSTRIATNTLGVHGHALPVQTVRWIALGGLLLAALAALIGLLPRFRGADDANARVQARYGHLIVPIAGLAPNPAHPPIDVTTIDALVALAERSERLILHHRGADADTYLVEDAGTLFRHRIRLAAAA